MLRIVENVSVPGCLMTFAEVCCFPDCLANAFRRGGPKLNLALPEGVIPRVIVNWFVPEVMTNPFFF